MTAHKEGHSGDWVERQVKIPCVGEDGGNGSNDFKESQFTRHDFETDLNDPRSQAQNCVLRKDSKRSG